jgi:hypothetical protein
MKQNYQKLLKDGKKYLKKLLYTRILFKQLF